MSVKEDDGEKQGTSLMLCGLVLSCVLPVLFICNVIIPAAQFGSSGITGFSGEYTRLLSDSSPYPPNQIPQLPLTLVSLYIKSEIIPGGSQFVSGVPFNASLSTLANATDCDDLVKPGCIIFCYLESIVWLGVIFSPCSINQKPTVISFMIAASWVGCAVSSVNYMFVISGSMRAAVVAMTSPCAGMKDAGQYSAFLVFADWCLATGILTIVSILCACCGVTMLLVGEMDEPEEQPAGAVVPAPSDGVESDGDEEGY